MTPARDFQGYWLSAKSAPESAGASMNRIHVLERLALAVLPVFALVTALRLFGPGASLRLGAPLPLTAVTPDTPPPDSLFRFAAYGDTRNGHEVHQEIVNAVMAYHPALVLQTGDLVADSSNEAMWQ